MPKRSKELAARLEGSAEERQQRASTGRGVQDGQARRVQEWKARRHIVIKYDVQEADISVHQLGYHHGISIFSLKHPTVLSFHKCEAAFVARLVDSSAQKGSKG